MTISCWTAAQARDHAAAERRACPPDAILADGRTWRFTTNGSIQPELAPWVNMSDLARRGVVVVWEETHLRARPEEWRATFGPLNIEPPSCFRA